MACHLDGGICPHDYPMGKGGSYLVFGSSSYGGGSSYAALGAYTAQSNGAYNGGMQSAQYTANPVGLAAYAANPTYNGAYKNVGAYISQTASQKSAGTKNTRPAFENYRSNSASNGQHNGRNTGEETEQDVPELLRQPRDVARPTIDDTVAPNVVAVQRDFLEQMIRNARSQTVAQQPQYMALYQ